MKTIIPLIFFFLLFFPIHSNIHAQESEKFDSIRIRNNPKYDLTYRIDDEYLQNVSLSATKHPKPVQLKGKHILGDFGSGLLTLVSGVGVGNTKENIDLKFTSKLTCKDDKHNWTLNLYTKGLMEKHRSRYGTDSGGFSMDIERSANVNWDLGAKGEILKNNIKVGDFILIKQPRFEKLSNNNPLEFLSDSLALDSTVDEQASNYQRTYTIIGQLHNQNFNIKADLKTKRYWLFQDKKLKAVLQLPRTVRFVEDKNTYALLDPTMSGTERTYWLKLALFNAYLSTILNKSVYNW